MKKNPILCLLLALAIRWLLTPPAALVRVSHVETSLPASGSDTRRAAWRLLMVYGLAGFGYIITATYLPLFLSGSLQSVDPVHLWALFGLAAAPSCLIWHKLVLKWGYRQALTRNLLVQALGVILPACSASLLFCVLSALLVGFTFMGTVTIALPKAKSLSHQVSFNMIAAMTALYGVGQIAGPLIAGALYQIAASFNPALYAAALALLRKYNAEPFHIQHGLTVEGVMRWYANELGYGEDADFWATVGLLQISWVVASHSGSLRQFSGSVISDSTLCGSRQA